jgi:uncharacterized protein YndB with AHSA1/START domain
MPDVTATDGPLREVRGERETVRGPAYGTVCRRRFDAPMEDVWDAITNAERINRWFLPVSGELRLGGRYQLEGNASGEILRCEPPTMLRVSWIYEDNYSELEVRLRSIGGGATVVEIEHLMRIEDLTGAGMSLSEGLVAAGAGWDLVLDGLGKYLRGQLDEPPTAEGDWEPTAEDEERYSQYEKLWQKVVKETLGKQAGLA